MIGNQTLGRGFTGLGSYLLTGRNRVHPNERVAWMDFRNLPTERMDVAIRIMAGTASLSSAAQPVFHLSISFAPGDTAGRELMLRVMVRTLSDLGLGEHQAVIVSHIDTEDPHVHAMVNRVHPETGLAWKGSWSRLRAEASLRRQELEEGLRVVPGWLAPVPGAPELRPKPRLARGGADFLRDVQDRATPVLELASSWAELERGLADLSLAVRVNGRGMSITDGRQEVKASEVGRAFSRAQLEKKFRCRYTDYSARVAVASATVRQPESHAPAGSAPVRASGTAESHVVAGDRVAGAERKRDARFTVMEEDGRVYVWDCVGPQIFFAETREGAEAEVQRANAIVARYPNIATVRCLRDMDATWRDAHRLPRLPESNYRGAWMNPPAAVATAPRAVIPPPLTLSAPEPEPDTVEPSFVELRESGPVGPWHMTISNHTSQEPGGPDRKEGGPARDPEHRLSEVSTGPAAEEMNRPAELEADDQNDREVHRLQVNGGSGTAPEPTCPDEFVRQEVVLDERWEELDEWEELAEDTSSSALEAFFQMVEQVQERRVLAAKIQETNKRIDRLEEWIAALDRTNADLNTATRGFNEQIQAIFRNPQAFADAFDRRTGEQQRAILLFLREQPAEFAAEFAHELDPESSHDARRSRGWWAASTGKSADLRVFRDPHGVKGAANLTANAGEWWLHRVRLYEDTRLFVARELGMAEAARWSEIRRTCEVRKAAADDGGSQVIEQRDRLPMEQDLARAFLDLSEEDRWTATKRLPQLARLIPKALRRARVLIEGPGDRGPGL